MRQCCTCWAPRRVMDMPSCQEAPFLMSHKVVDASSCTPKRLFDWARDVNGQHLPSLTGAKGATLAICKRFAFPALASPLLRYRACFSLPGRGRVHVRVFPHGFKGQNESRRELQNGLGKAMVQMSSEFDLFLVGGFAGEIWPELDLVLDRFVTGGVDGRGSEKITGWPDNMIGSENIVLAFASLPKVTRTLLPNRRLRKDAAGIPELSAMV